MLTKFKEENRTRLKRTLSRFNAQDGSLIPLKGRNGTKYTGGIPLAYEGEEKMVYLDPSDTHTLVYGATGSLKTRSIVMPAIKIIGRAGESMIINDSKGELYNRLAKELIEEGYGIITINLRDPSVGNSWNPLEIPYAFYLKGDIDKATELANDIAANLMINEMDHFTEDPFWDYSSSDLLFGLILSLFKYCSEHGKGREAINIMNIIKLRRVLFERGVSAKNTPLWKYLSEDELIASSLSGAIFAAHDTQASILSVFDQHIRAFSIQPTLMDMLSSSDFDIGAIAERKTAVFLITPDEKTTYHRLVSLFVKQSYEYFIYQASLKDDITIENRLNYILDEFNALPVIMDMPSMISAARSRNIRFLLVVQSKNSLKKKYKEEAETIISNCSNIIFFTSRELELLRELSELCGKQRNGEPNISVYELQHLSKEHREALVLSGRLEPALVRMIDIDMFPEADKGILEFSRGQRLSREMLDFKLRPEIEEKFAVKIEPPKNPFDFPERQARKEPEGSELTELVGLIEEKTEKLSTAENNNKEGSDDGK